MSTLKFIEDSIFSQVHAFGIFLKYQTSVAMCTHVWDIDFAPLVHMSIFVPISYCYHYYSTIALLYHEICSSLNYYSF